MELIFILVSTLDKDFFFFSGLENKLKIWLNAVKN